MPKVLECSSVDEFDEINRALGWQTEYRQLKRGSFRARICAVANSEGLLTREDLSGFLEVHAEEPTDTVSILIPFNRPSVAALSPESSALSPSRGQAVAIDVGTEACMQLSRAAGLILRADDELSRSTRENVAELLCRVLAIVAESGSGSGKQQPRLARQTVLRRAVEIIETSLHAVIRVSDLCRRSHVGVRTLERLFAQEFGVSPSGTFWPDASMWRGVGYRRRVLR